MRQDLCVCRNCKRNYDQNRSRADWMGYCCRKCEYEKAKSLGFSKAREKREGRQLHSEYKVLSAAKEIGRVPARREDR